MAATRVPSGATLCGSTSNVTPMIMQQQSQTAGDSLLNSNSTRSGETYQNSTSTRYINFFFQNDIFRKKKKYILHFKSYVIFSRSIQNVLPGGSNSDVLSGDQLMPMCELGEPSNMRPLGSSSTLSSISSKTSLKQHRVNNLSVVEAEPPNMHSTNDSSVGDCPATSAHSPPPSYSSPTVNQQQLNQQLNLLSSSSSSDSGVRYLNKLKSI